MNLICFYISFFCLYKISLQSSFIIISTHRQSNAVLDVDRQISRFGQTIGRETNTRQCSTFNNFGQVKSQRENCESEIWLLAIEFYRFMIASKRIGAFLFLFWPNQRRANVLRPLKCFDQKNKSGSTIVSDEIINHFVLSIVDFYGIVDEKRQPSIVSNCSFIGILNVGVMRWRDLPLKKSLIP